MTLTAVPYALQNASHSAQLFREAIGSLISPAGGLVQTGDLQVVQTSTPSMAVMVGAGRIWTPGSDLASINPGGGAYNPQALYFSENDEPVTLPISAANATNPRLDQVIVQVQDGQYGGSTNTASLAVVTGTPTAGASLTNLVGLGTVPSSSSVLGRVLVPANATSIVTGNIANVLGIAQPQTKPLLYRYQQTASNYSTTSTSLVAVDSTNMNPSLVLGGTVRVTLTCSFSVTGSPYQGVFDLLIDGSPLNDRLYVLGSAANQNTASLSWTFQPTAGVHTVAVAYANNQAGTMTLYGASASQERCTFMVERIG